MWSLSRGLWGSETQRHQSSVGEWAFFMNLVSTIVALSNLTLSSQYICLFFFHLIQYLLQMIISSGETQFSFCNLYITLEQVTKIRHSVQDFVFLVMTYVSLEYYACSGTGKKIVNFQKYQSGAPHLTHCLQLLY